MLKNLLRVALFIVGLFGLLLLVAGLAATLADASIVLPGLGLIVSGPLVLLLGLFIIAAVLVAAKATAARAKLP